MDSVGVGYDDGSFNEYIKDLIRSLLCTWKSEKKGDNDSEKLKKKYVKMTRQQYYNL